MSKVHRPIIFITKDIEEREKALKPAIESMNQAEKDYNIGLMKRNPNIDELEDNYMNKKATVSKLHKELDELKKELKSEKDRQEER